TIERQLAYNAVTKEYKVIALKGETHPAYGTRDLRDAQRVFSEVRALKLGPSTALNPAEIFYVRVQAEAALNGENTFVTRMAGTAEQTERQSDYRTVQRMQWAVPLLAEQNRRKRNLLVILGFLVLVGGLSVFDLGSFAPELPVASNIVIFALFNLN